ncbi:hypothetical protein F5Y15DRAFT_408272 [Xylariaceae sp. FL0016]|nr:hypothetical protein F5Y15DRAFT_408272 [Xylariaceae sp. FL0016]
MLSFRRALFFAVFFITAFVLLRRSHQTSQDPVIRRPPPKSQSADNGNPSTSNPASPQKPLRDQPVPAQKAIQDMSKMSLYDKLAYQYPYDTWKYTPENAEFQFREQEASWSRNHPGFVHEVITDQVAVYLLRMLYASVPEVLEAYNSLPEPVLKADFFRYLILLARGGIYSDIDTVNLKSALDWLPDSVPKESIGLVVGIEADPDRPDWKDWYSRRIQFCQWTIQSKSGHPVLRDIVARITAETLKRKEEGRFLSKEKSIVEFTGPAIWTDTIFDYLNDPRYFDMSHSTGNISYMNFTGMETPKKVGDVVVLPITSFSPGVQQMGAKDYDDPMAFVKHDFEEHFASIVSQYGGQPAVIARAPALMDTSPPSISSISSIPEETILTYASLDALSNALAQSLQSLGVQKGDRVAVSLGNCAEYVALTYAVFKLGAILVPLNPSFNEQQLTAALGHLGVEVLIIGAVTDLAYKPCRGRSNLPLLRSLIPDLERGGGKIESASVPTLKSVVLLDNASQHPQSGFPDLETLKALTPYASLLPSAFSPSSPASLSSSRSPVPSAPLHPDETINIQFTSGTTSLPKAAMLSHTSILNNGHLIAARMGLDPSDKMVVPPPLFHCFGCVLGLQATATTGAAILFPSPAFDPAATLRTAAAHRATGLYGVATMFVAELELLASPAFARQLPEGGLSALRKGIAAGSSVPESLMRRLYAGLGLRDLVICYGMTETSPVSCMTSPADPFAARTRSVGRAMPHTRVKVVRPGARDVVVPRGERGELACAGYLVMQGYWGDEARTREDRIADAEGTVWMYSGDEAALDADGYVEITGRIKDLIIRGGENIHPLEVENCLFQHPLIKEASVVGVPDERYGEVVGAFVVPHRGVRTVDGDGSESAQKVLSKQDVREWAKTNLSSHLSPKYVFWVDEYPKTASGKIQKYKLRELAKTLLS